jgi:hypothetical protein
MELIKKEWKKSRYPIPKVYYAEYEGNYYLTIEDYRTVCLFLNISTNQVFAAVKFKCKLEQFKNNIAHYTIKKDDLQVISCTTSFSDLSKYVIDTIKPIFINIIKLQQDEKNL